MIPTYFPDTPIRYLVTIDMSSNKLKIGNITQADIGVLLPYLSYLVSTDYQGNECPFEVKIEILEGN